MGRPRRNPIEATIAETLGPALRAERRRCGLLAQDVAQALGVKPQAVSAWECGKIVPVLTNLIGLARLYRMRLTELLQVVDAAMTPPISVEQAMLDAFADFDAGKSVRDVVSEYREDLETVRNWHDRWRKARSEAKSTEMASQGQEMPSGVSGGCPSGALVGEAFSPTGGPRFSAEPLANSSSAPELGSLAPE